jgi:tetratricopeptide (TPR) repeat protein
MNNIEQSEIKNLISNCDYTTALKKLEQKNSLFPNDIFIINSLIDVYFNLDKIDECKKTIKKSIKISPNSNPEKYFTLAQLETDKKKSLENYKKGIEIMEKLENKDKNILDLISSGYASIANLYMTTNLCDEIDAENICENSLKKGLEINENNIDCLIQLSNLRILRKKDDEVKLILKKIHDLIFKMNFSDEDFPEREILFNFSKNYAEINDFKNAIKIIKLILKIDDLDIECWYYLSFYQYKNENYEDCAETLKKFEEIYEKNKNNNDWDENMINDVIDASKELYEVLEKMPKPLVNNNEDNEDENNENNNENNENINENNNENNDEKMNIDE